MARLFPLAVAVDLVALGASGLGLTINYRPELVEVRSGVGAAVLRSQPGGAVLADIHRAAAVVALMLLAGLVIAVGARLVRSQSSDAVLAGAVVIALVGGGVGFVSGDRLPWSQVGLWATMGPAGGIRGVWRPAFDPVVRFVVVHGEVERAAYRGRVLLHLFAAPAVLLAGLGLAWFRSRLRPLGSVAGLDRRVAGHMRSMYGLLWLIAVVLVIAGIVTAVRGEVLTGIALIILGCLVGPGGVSIFA